MRQLAKRVHSLEAEASGSSAPEVWHQLIWDVGQAWDDVLAEYGGDRIKPGDGILLITLIDADGGKPVRDPIRERDQSKADAWLAAHEESRP